MFVTISHDAWSILLLPNTLHPRSVVAYVWLGIHPAAGYQGEDDSMLTTAFVRLCMCLLLHRFRAISHRLYECIEAWPKHRAASMEATVHVPSCW